MEQFEVIFLDEDKLTVLDKQIIDKNKKAIYKGKIPVKETENGVKYSFDGWENEEKLESVNENITLIAKYKAETVTNSLEDVFYNATLEVAKTADINNVMRASEKMVLQMKNLEKDSRTAEEIVNAVLKDGKTEIAPEKNDIER